MQQNECSHWETSQAMATARREDWRHSLLISLLVDDAELDPSFPELCPGRVENVRLTSLRVCKHCQEFIVTFLDDDSFGVVSIHGASSRCQSGMRLSRGDPAGPIHTSRAA